MGKRFTGFDVYFMVVYTESECAVHLGARTTCKGRTIKTGSTTFNLSTMSISLFSKFRVLWAVRSETEWTGLIKGVSTQYNRMNWWYDQGVYPTFIGMAPAWRWNSRNKRRGPSHWKLNWASLCLLICFRSYWLNYSEFFGWNHTRLAAILTQ